MEYMPYMVHRHVKATVPCFRLLALEFHFTGVLLGNDTMRAMCQFIVHMSWPQRRDSFSLRQTGFRAATSLDHGLVHLQQAGGMSVSVVGPNLALLCPGASSSKIQGTGRI